MSKYLIAGNWKMNTNISEAKKLVSELKDEVSFTYEVDMLVCPPFTHLYPLSELVTDTKIKLGAQNSYYEESGAFTGEVSNDMIKSVGCQSVILGHSERREIFNESNEIINLKVKKTLNSGLNVILCIGESETSRENGQTNNILEKQLTECLAEIKDDTNLTIAYEPIWAIGTGKSATPNIISETHTFIKSYLNNHFGDNSIKILYGGSMKPENAESILRIDNVNGGLIGGASLKSDSFNSIYKIACNLI